MNDSQYKILCSRREKYDQMLWQTPPLAVAAQSFLLSTAFKSDTQHDISLILSSISFLVAIASIILMVKHRGYEIADSEVLKKVEEDDPELEVIHGPRSAKDIPNWVKAYYAWQVVLISLLFLAIFGMVRASQLTCSLTS